VTILLPGDEDGIARAAAIIREGGIVALPTETVYGLAGNALSAAAVDAIYAAKGRPSDNPLIVHLASVDDLPSVVRFVPDEALLLADALWPGPLSLVLPRRPQVPDRVTAGLDTLAVRVPAHEVFRSVIQAAGVPLAAPSANRAGSPSPTTAAHVLADLAGRIPAVLDGGRCAVGVESTVIDLTATPPRLLRPGGVPLEALRSLIGDVVVDPAVVGDLAADRVPGAPGMKYRHYAPAAPLVIIEGSAADAAAWIAAQSASVPRPRLVEEDATRSSIGVLCFDEDADVFTRLGTAIVVTYGPSADPAAQARNLFSALRSLDQPGITHIYARAPSSGCPGIGQAVRNRLLKAAGFTTIQPGEHHQ
jgi:L-threonylcarbamoyladenylate synthase